MIDEGRYYEADFYLTEYYLERVRPADKAIVVKLLYTENHRHNEMSETLQSAGFFYADTLLHTRIDPNKAIDRFEGTCNRIEKMLCSSGFSFGPVPMQELETVRKFLEQIAEIPYYQRHLRTQEEYQDDIIRKRFFYVVSPMGKVCAAQYFAGDDKKFYGMLGIQESYRARYGIILLLGMYGWKYAQEHGMQEYGWIREDNIESIRYHEKTGWEWTGRKMSEWVIEAV